jgi:broad specificity phosphatase PhoE
MGRVVLIRHTDVAAHWKGRCYGQSDVGLSATGLAAARTIAENLVLAPATFLIASPLRRARFLAGLIARKANLEVSLDNRLAECNFGSWEGRTWNEIYAETGSAMMGLVTAPDKFRPGGGETTFELRDRAMAWLETLKHGERPIIAIAHGGPIAAIRGTLSGAPVHEWPSLVPAYGAAIDIEI